MKHKSQKISVMLAGLALAAFLLPVNLWAQQSHYVIDLSTTSGSGTGYSWSGTTLTFTTAANDNTYELTGGGGQERNVTISANVNTTVTINGINISGNINVDGTQLKLLLSGTNKIAGHITVVAKAKLIIDSATGSGSENGLLSITNKSESYAVIGGLYDSGEVIINGGTIVATQISGASGAVIGGGSNGTGNVTITGGNVTATLPGGAGSGAAIGGGSGKNGTVNISGGIITATTYDHNHPSSGTSGAAIGGGAVGALGGTCNINITGGIITATAANGAAIGNGSGDASPPRGTIKISGATIAAYSVSGSGIGVGRDNANSTVPTYNISSTADITVLIRNQYNPSSGSPICGIIGDGENEGNGYFVNLYRMAGQGESFKANTVYVFDTDMTLLRVIPVPENFTFGGAFEWVSFTAGPVTSPATNYKVYLDSGNGLYEIIRYDNHRHPTLNLPIHSVNKMKGYDIHEYPNPSDFIPRNQLLMVNGKDFGYGTFWLVIEKYVDKYGNPIKGVSDKGEMIVNNEYYKKESILDIPGYDYLGYKWSPFDGAYTSGTPNKQITGNDTICFVYECNLPPVIEFHPEADEPTICENSNGGFFSTSLSVTVIPEEKLTYQWYVNTTKSNSGGTKIEDATQSTYTPPNTVSGIYYYYCIVTGECGLATSNVSGIHMVTPSVKPEVKISVTVE